MRIDAHSKRRNGGISAPDLKGVGRLALTADNDAEREFLSAIYFLIGAPIGGPTPEARAKVYNDARKVLDGWIKSFPKKAPDSWIYTRAEWLEKCAAEENQTNGS